MAKLLKNLDEWGIPPPTSLTGQPDADDQHDLANFIDHRGLAVSGTT
jgi:hypothetical protein